MHTSQDPQPPRSRGTVFIVGESLVDVAVGADGVERRMPGGSPMNVAFGLGRLGVPATLLTSFGDDADGQLIAAHLDSAGVRLAGGSVIPGGTTSTALARLGSDGSAAYEFDVRWDIPEDSPVPEDTVAVHAGSLGTVIEPGAERTLALFERAGDGVLRSFDPNVRPTITPDNVAALGWVERFGRLTDILKLSDEDAAWLLPGASHEDVAEWALGLGVLLFAMTRGAEGCVLVTRHERIEQPGIPTHVVDTIGAGDAFMAALIAGVHHWELGDSLRAGRLAREEIEALAALAQRAAAATVGRAGAQPPHWADVAPEAPGDNGVTPGRGTQT